MILATANLLPHAKIVALPNSSAENNGNQNASSSQNQTGIINIGPLTLKLPKDYIIKKKPDPGKENAPFAEARFEHKDDRGHSVYIMSIALKPEEAAKTAKKSAAENIQHMANMLSKNNMAPKVNKAALLGDFSYAFVESQNPSGMPFQNFIGCHFKDGRITFVIMGFEKHRSSGKVRYDRADLEIKFKSLISGI